MKNGDLSFKLDIMLQCKDACENKRNSTVEYDARSRKDSSENLIALDKYADVQKSMCMRLNPRCLRKIVVVIGTIMPRMPYLA